MDKMREEFEAYCRKRWPKQSLTFRYDLSYVDDSIEDAWLVWQASRAALVVHLPNHEEYFLTSSLDCAVKMALDNAGVKWTE